MSLGNFIRQRRKSLNITLQTLANQVDADAGNLSRIERGELGINETLLRKVAAALDCTPAYLYAQSDAPLAQLTAQENRQPYLVNPLQTSNTKDFVQWFRSATPYIHAFGGRTFVIAFGGEVVDEKQFIALSHDLNLLASLEVRLVPVSYTHLDVYKRQTLA